MIWPQAKGSWQPPEARRGLEQTTPQNFQKKLTLQTSSSKTPASGTVGEHISVCGTCHGSHRSHASLCPPLQLGCGHTAPLCPDFAPAPVPGCVQQCPWGCGRLGTVPCAGGGTAHLGLRCTACHPHGVGSVWDLEHPRCCRDTEPRS